jgi:hypothetical protein
MSNEKCFTGGNLRILYQCDWWTEDVKWTIENCYPLGTGCFFLSSKLKRLAGETDRLSAPKAKFIKSYSCISTPGTFLWFGA